MSQPFLDFSVTNLSPVRCFVAGYPRVRLLGHPGFAPSPRRSTIIPIAIRHSFHERIDCGPRRIVLAPGARAYFGLGTATAYPGRRNQFTVTWVRVVPPGTHSSTLVQVDLGATRPPGRRVPVGLTALTAARAATSCPASRPRPRSDRPRARRGHRVPAAVWRGYFKVTTTPLGATVQGPSGMRATFVSFMRDLPAFIASHLPSTPSAAGDNVGIGGDRVWAVHVRVQAGHRPLPLSTLRFTASPAAWGRAHRVPPTATIARLEARAFGLDLLRTVPPRARAVGWVILAVGQESEQVELGVRGSRTVRVPMEPSAGPASQGRR